MLAIIRHATRDDLPVLVQGLIDMLKAMHEQGGPPLTPDTTLRASLHTHVAQRIDLDHGLYLVASRSDVPVGILEATHKNGFGVFAIDAWLHIHAVHVTPTHRRQGIARQLMQHALDWGRTRGCQRATLNVLTSNPAQHLYHALGFHTVEYAMAKPLTDL